MPRSADRSRGGRLRLGGSAGRQPIVFGQHEGDGNFYEAGHLEGRVDMYEMVKAVCAEQIRTISKVRLGERIGTLSKTEIRDLCALLADMYGTA